MMWFYRLNNIINYMCLYPILITIWSDAQTYIIGKTRHTATVISSLFPTPKAYLWENKVPSEVENLKASITIVRTRSQSLDCEQLSHYPLTVQTVMVNRFGRQRIMGSQARATKPHMVPAVLENRFGQISRGTNRTC